MSVLFPPALKYVRFVCQRSLKYCCNSIYNLELRSADRAAIEDRTGHIPISTGLRKSGGLTNGWAADAVSAFASCGHAAAWAWTEMGQRTKPLSR
jgi:hypothetical protein